MTAQDHFSGRIQMDSACCLVLLNPAELSNLNSKYEINFFSASINAANNKVGFN
jgi:hypothetical protein